MIRILHTGDVHLGKPFKDFGKFGRKLRQQLRKTFFQLLRQAPRNVDLVLIAGDLVDSNQPDLLEVKHVLSAIKEAAPLPVCLLPGTHDCLSPDSVYRRPEFTEGQCPGNLRLFRKDGPQTFHFEQLSVAVHGRANLANRGGEPPLKDLRPDAKAKFNVAVAHASVPLPRFDADDEHDYFVRMEDAQRSGMDYIALAHWHRFGNCFPGSPVRAFYSGCPEAIEFAGPEARGCWALVKLSEEDPTVTQVPSGEFTWRELEVDLTGQSEGEAVRRQLEQYASSQTILRLRVSGRPAAHYRFPTSNFEESFGSEFAHLDISDETVRDVALEEMTASFTPKTVADFFCRVAQEKLQAASLADRDHWKEVLRRGSALLLDKENV